MDPRAQYLAAFAQAEPQHQAEAPGRRLVRQQALARFAALGFPTEKEEAWRFTSLAALADRSFGPAPRAVPDATIAAAVAAGRRDLAGDLGGPCLVFVDGLLAPSLSELGALAPGALLGTMAAPPRWRADGVASGLARDASEGDALAALNAALTQDGAVLRVPHGLALDRPVSLLFVATGGQAAHPRSVIALGEGSRATVVETYLALGPDASFTNAATEVEVGAGAHLDHYRLTGGGDAFLVGRAAYRLGRDADLAAHAVTFGGTLVRHDLRATVEAGASAALGGLYLAGGAEHVDHHLLVDHAAPGGRSRSLYKGVLAGHARAVFEGAVAVRPDAQRTDAVVANHNLLVSDDATVNSKPQFNIHADDVKCTHGATVGQLREDEIFYLRSRGLDREAAGALLLQAFAGEALAGIGLAPLRAAIDGRILDWLPRQARLREAA